MRKPLSRPRVVLNRLAHLYRRSTSGSRALPAFIIIGAAKAGTSSLFNYLAQHPYVAPPFTKEPHFFDYNFRRGVNWYKSFFPRQGSGPSARMTGEATPYYLFHPLAAQRVAGLLPEVKLICLLRNPIDRTYSSYRNQVRIGVETLSFDETLALEDERLAGEEERIIGEEPYFSFNHMYYSYRTRGLYARQLERWWQHFDRDSQLILSAEELFRDPEDVFSRTLEFLGLPTWSPPRFEVFNRGPKGSGMSPETREALRRFFEPHNERLFEALGERYSWD